MWTKKNQITTWNLAVTLVNYELHQNQHKFNSPAVLLYIKNEVFVFYRTQHLRKWNSFTSIPLWCTIRYFVFPMFSWINWFMHCSRLNLIMDHANQKKIWNSCTQYENQSIVLIHFIIIIPAYCFQLYCRQRLT